MPDFEVMPIGTRKAMEEAEQLLRQIDGCAYTVAADKLAKVLKQPGVDNADASGD